MISALAKPVAHAPSVRIQCLPVPLSFESYDLGSTPFDGQLEEDFEATWPVGEWAPDPSFKARLIGGHESAGRKPSPKQPVQRAHLQIDRSANFDFSNLHGWKLHPTDFAAWSHVGNFETNVVAALLVGYDFWVVPHVSEPLSVP